MQRFGAKLPHVFELTIGVDFGGGNYSIGRKNIDIFVFIIHNIHSGEVT